MSFEQFITDEQDAKVAEKVIGKLKDMLSGGERILYLAVQKKPAVTLMPDSVVVTDRRIVFCSPGNLGLTTNFEIFLWKDIKEVSFKEEFFGAKFTAVPHRGENMTVDYIPKVQARKLFQFSNQQLEQATKVEPPAVPAFQEKPVESISEKPIVAEEIPAVVPSAPVEITEDEVTLKLKKLKALFERELISQEEYETKKADILSQL